jgi:hypothetical protein
VARQYTGKEVHGIVDEGRTGRLIGRRILRRGLGNPKKRVVEFRNFGMEMYARGFQGGGEYMRGRIHNSVSALDYGASYYVAPSIDDSSDPVGDSGGADANVVPIQSHHGHDPEAGDFPSS